MELDWAGRESTCIFAGPTAGLVAGTTAQALQLPDLESESPGQGPHGPWQQCLDFPRNFFHRLAGVLQTQMDIPAASIRVGMVYLGRERLRRHAVIFSSDTFPGVAWLFFVPFQNLCCTYLDSQPAHHVPTFFPRPSLSYASTFRHDTLTFHFHPRISSDPFLPCFTSPSSHLINCCSLQIFFFSVFSGHHSPGTRPAVCQFWNFIAA